MRTYTQIFKDYLKWVVKRTGDLNYKYDTFMSNHDEKEAKAFLFKSIYDLCYDPKDGLYYFCKFIVGDLRDIGYPTPFRFNRLLRKWDKLVKRYKHLTILSARGHGKELADSTPIYTPNGWKTHGDLKIGDKVFHPSGKAIEVLWKSEKHKDDYVVEFENGEQIRTHKRHEWLVYDAKFAKYKTLETQEMINNVKYRKTHNRFLINSIKPLHQSKKELLIDPYFLGLWLGDGSSNGAIITHDKKDTKSIDSISYKISARYEHKTTGVITTRFGGNKIISKLKKLKLFNNKHIPEIYLKSSIKQRLELVAGLIDSDGNVATNCNKIRFVNTNKKIVNGLVQILRTLGLRPYVTIQKPDKNGHTLHGHLVKGKKIVYTVNFVSNINIPTRISRKKIKTTKLKRIGIKSIRYEPNGEMGNCITVDSEDGLYVVGKSMVPTHNSVFFSELLNIYDMFLFSHKKILVESASQEQANRIVGEIKTIIENNEWLVTKKDPNKWATDSIGYNEGLLVGKGFGSEVLGYHVDRIVIDDILRSDNKLSDEQIEDFLDMTLEPMILNRKGQIILVGCVNENTMVLTENGFKKIKSLKKTNEKIEPLNKEIYGIESFHTATEIFDNGIKKTKKIVFEHGYNLECTPNHPILVMSDDSHKFFKWKKAEDLTTKDYAVLQYDQNVWGNDDSLPIPAMKREHKKHSTKKITKELAYLLGLYLAEGSMYKEDSITITNTEVSDFLMNNNMSMNFVDKRKDNTHFTYNSRYFIKQMKLLGFDHLTCENKIIPDSVFGWKKELIIEFIKGYADGDGCASRNTVKFTSTSKQLLKQLQVLLLNFGIVSSLTSYDGRNKNRKNGFAIKKIRYDLNVLSSFAKVYLEKIGFGIKRKQQKLKNNIINASIYIPNIYPLLKKTLSTVKKKTNIKNCHHIYNKNNINNKISDKKLKNFIKEFKREKANSELIANLEYYLNANYYFIKPTSIKNGKSRTMDFIIPQTHSFVSNGIISHNTPKSETDIFTTVFGRSKVENSAWSFNKFPAIVDYENKILLCPDRFTWEDIMQKRLSMGPLKFAREYQLDFFSRDTSLFPYRILKMAKDKGANKSIIYKADKRDPTWSFVVGVDVARSGSISADYTVATVLAYNNVTQEKQVVHVWREKGLKISEQAASLAELSKAFDHPLFLVEQNNMGQDMIDELVDTYNVNVEGFVTGGKGQKKEELIRFLIRAFEYEQFSFPQGDEHSREIMSVVEGELAKFCETKTPAGNYRYEGLGSHDDCVDSLALANRATQLMGVPFAVQTFGQGKTGEGFETFLNTSDKESDLVKMIKLGLIK